MANKINEARIQGKLERVKYFPPKDSKKPFAFGTIYWEGPFGKLWLNVKSWDVIADEMNELANAPVIAYGELVSESREVEGQKRWETVLKVRSIKADGVVEQEPPSAAVEDSDLPF